MTHLKKATIKDIPVIQDLAKKSWSVHYQGIISDDQITYMLDKMYSTEELTSHFNNTDYHYYIITDLLGKHFGFMGFEHHYEDNTTKLHRIYLIPEAKGKGYGKKAIQHLKDLVKKAQNKRIILNVNKANKAKDFYESQGFNIYDTTILQIGNGYVMDDYLMEFKM